MKKFFLIIFISLLGLLAYAGIFYYRNLRGAGPAVRKPPEDIVALLPGSGENKTSLPLKLPDGFSIEIFAKNLPGARVMAFDAQGNMWVSRTGDGIVMRLAVMDGKVVKQEDIFINLQKPHGLAFDPKNPDILYIAEENKISNVQLSGNKKLKKIADLPSGGGHRTHFSRTIGFGPDGRLYVSIGSSCNVCREDDERRAAIYSMNPDGSDFKQVAKGLRNAPFFTWTPDGKMWVTEMGRDELGDDLPPDEINIIDPAEGVKNYGWPICYGKNIHDTNFDKNTYISNPCLEPFETPSHIDLPAHSAPLGLAFVPKDSAWPKEYWNDLLVAYHGSWNRSEPTGYKIVRLKLGDDGNFEREEDFVSGWLEGDKALGRPVHLLALHDGVMYASDDKAGVIYRIYRTPATPENLFAPIVNIEEQADMIRVTNIQPNGTISDTATVDGLARSWWFSDDRQFTVRVVDAEGITIGQYSALALEKFDPTKDEMVPFRASLAFEPPRTATGFLVLERSGWEEIVGGWKNVLVFPVRFK